MIIGLFEDAKAHYGFLPITRTRPLWQVWWGIDRLIDKWARYYGWQVAAQWHASPLLHPLYPYKIPVFETAEDARRFLWINARLLPWTPDLPRLVESLPPQSAYIYKDEIPPPAGHATYYRTFRMDAGSAGKDFHTAPLAGGSYASLPGGDYGPFSAEWRCDRG